MLRVKIVCTIGPASREMPILRRIAAAGMNVARLNMSHGTHEDHAQTYQFVREASDESGHGVGILADLQGPKIRLGSFVDGSTALTRAPGDRPVTLPVGIR